MKRPSGSLIVSIALHALAAALLLTIVRVPVMISDHFSRVDPQVQERIGFMRLPDLGMDTPGREGGDGRPITDQPPRETPLVAPTTVPVGVPDPGPAAQLPAAEGGAGPVIGRGGIRHGIMPSQTDARLWSDPPPEPRLPLSPRERVDSVIDVSIRAYHDSVANAPRERRPTDWTFERGGKRYGMDERRIYIGDRSLPTAVLALLPLNVQSNPIAGEREKAIAQMRQTIQEQAQRAAVDDDFNAALKRIRERRDRERDERREQERVEPAPVP